MCKQLLVSVILHLFLFPSLSNLWSLHGGVEGGSWAPRPSISADIDGPLSPTGQQTLGLFPSPQGYTVPVLCLSLQAGTCATALQGLTPSLLTWEEVTTNQKPALRLAWALQPIRDTWAQAFLRSQLLSLKRGESLATGYFRGRSKRSPRLFEREDERKRKT